MNIVLQVVNSPVKTLSGSLHSVTICCAQAEVF